MFVFVFVFVCVFVFVIVLDVADTENTWFVWSRTSYSGDIILKWRCYQCGTDGRTREDRATQPMDAGWLSFATLRKYMKAYKSKHSIARG